jgi:hypothetical protein
MEQKEIDYFKKGSNLLQEKIMHFGWAALDKDDLTWLFNAFEDILEALEKGVKKTMPSDITVQHTPAGDGFGLSKPGYEETEDRGGWGGTGGKPGFNGWLED